MYVPVAQNNKQESSTTLDFSSSVMMTDSVLIRTLSDIDRLSERDIFDIVKNYYQNRKSRCQYQNISYKLIHNT